MSTEEKEEKEEQVTTPPSDEDEDPEREMNSMRDKFRSERPSNSPVSDKRDSGDVDDRERPKKREREERKDEFGRIIRDDSPVRASGSNERKKDKDHSPKQSDRSPPREGKERRGDDKDQERDKETKDARETRDKDAKDIRDSRDKEKDNKDKEKDRDREREREKDRDRDRDRDSRDRDRDRDSRDRDRDMRDSRDGRDPRGDRDRERDREREARDRDRDREGRDRDRDYGYGRSHSRERRPLSAPVRERSPPFKRRREDLDNPQDKDWDRPGADRYYYDRNFTPPGYRPGYDRDPYYPPQDRGAPPRGQPPPMHQHPQQRGAAGAGGAAAGQRPPTRARASDLYEGPLRTYKQFLETQDDHITPQEAEKKYEEYKIKMMAENKKRQARVFFREHKHEDWFREKYEPAFLEKKKQDKDELSRSNAKAFASKLAEGEIKFTLEAEAHLEEGEQMEDEEEEAVIASTEGEDGEKEMEEAGEIGEDTTSAEPKEGSEKETKDPADTDSASAEGEDSGTTEGGPKMISTKPSVQRKNDRLDQALDSQPGQPAQQQQQQQQAQQNQNKRAIEPPRDPNTLFIKTVPPTCSRVELLEVLNKITESEHPCKLLLSEPMRMKNFHRIGWVTYSSYDLCTKALKELNGYKFKDFELQMTINKPNNAESQARKFKLAPDYAGTEQRVAHDYEQCNELMQLFDKERAIEENPLLTSSDWESLSTIEKLDREIYYMRSVHTYCYYCAEQFEDEDDLRRRCGSIHLRAKNKKKEVTDVTPSDKATTWAAEVDTKIKERIAKPDSPEEYTGKKQMEQDVEELYKENVKRLEEEKYRCVFCSKLFRGDEFVRKHIVGKHMENITEVREKALEEQFFNNYWNDPRHIQPVNNNQQNQRNQQQQQHNAVNRNSHALIWDGPGHPGLLRQVPQPLPGGRPGGRNFQQQQGAGGRMGGGGVPLPVPVRVSPQARRQENRYAPFPTRRPPIVMAPPPQTGFHDPRGIREYVDLDAPAEDVPQIDYRTAT